MSYPDRLRLTQGADETYSAKANVSAADPIVLAILTLKACTQMTRDPRTLYACQCLMMRGERAMLSARERSVPPTLRPTARPERSTENDLGIARRMLPHLAHGAKRIPRRWRRSTPVSARGRGTYEVKRPRIGRATPLGISRSTSGCERSSERLAYAITASRRPPSVTTGRTSITSTDAFARTGCVSASHAICATTMRRDFASRVPEFAPDRKAVV